MKLLSLSGSDRKYAITMFLFVAFLAGVVLGSIFYMTSIHKAEVDSHFLDVIGKIASDKQNMSISKSIFIQNTVYAFIIFFSAFFKFGNLIIVALNIRMGFVAGFICAVSVASFGMLGELLILTTAIDTSVNVIITILLSAISLLALFEEEKSKKTLIFFLFFSISIFCVTAFFRGYVTTIFMKLIYPKMI